MAELSSCPTKVFIVDVSQAQLIAARTYCRKLATTHYENFSVASLLIPKSLRQDFFNIYAYCRRSDDLADEQPSPDHALKALKSWRIELKTALQGASSDDPILTALVETVKRRKLATQPFFDLLDAFDRDQVQNRYATSADLLSYCRCSANPVGRILLDLAEVRSESELTLSDQICSGLQLINFCQDMARDAAINRIYMPQELSERHQVAEEMILEAQPTERLKAALQEWVTDSRQYFLRGWQLWKSVPKWLARDIHLFAGGGLAICDAIAEQQFDVWTCRPTVNKATKLKLLLRACVSHRLPKSKYFAND